VDQLTDQTRPSGALSAEETATLLAVCRRVFPHDALPDAPYERWAGELEARARDEAEFASLLHEGLASLDADGRRFVELAPDDQLERLRAIESTTFFGGVRASGVVGLYDNPEVWDALGWEGASFDEGGYLHRGFNDLDWLPDAHDGSL
jgi:hypothetical protein